MLKAETFMIPPPFASNSSGRAAINFMLSSIYLEISIIDKWVIWLYGSEIWK